MEYWFPFVVVLAVFLSLASAIFSWSCRPSNHRHLSTEKRLRELESDATDLHDGWTKCLTALKRINQREVMRERRAEKIPEESTEESDEEWKARMNREELQMKLKGVS